MYLAIRTQTSHLPHPNLGLNDPSQPQLLHFAGVVFDETGKEHERLVTFVRPRPEAAVQTAASPPDTVSLEQAFHLGMKPIDVFRWFAARAKKADRLVGHNVILDIIAMAIISARTSTRVFAPSCEFYCTMAETTHLVNSLPTDEMMAIGRYQPKPPTLAECVEHFFSEKLPEPSDPSAEVSACVRIFRHLVHEKNYA